MNISSTNKNHEINHKLKNESRKFNKLNEVYVHFA